MSKSHLAPLQSIVAFGDSITRGYGLNPGEGWVELMSESLKKTNGTSISVFNAGGNGNTSAEGLSRIETDVLAHMPGVALVEFGGNDTVHDTRAVTVDEFERNLLAIHEKVVNKGGEIVFLTFPPVVNEWHSTHSDPYYNPWNGIDQCVEQYRHRTRELAKRLNAPLFDLDELLREKIFGKEKETYVSRDGVHLTAFANKLIAESVLKFLRNIEKL